MQLISLTFSDRHRATEVLADLGDLSLDWGVPLDQAAAAVTVSKRGHVRVHQSHEAASAGAFLGGMAGFVAGLLVLAPGVGTAIGAATGGAIGSAADPLPLAGVDKDFLKSFGENLERDSSALVVIVPDAGTAAALATLKAYDDGVIAQTVLDAATESAVEDAYAARTA